MTNTVFPTFQTQYILDFSSASCSGTRGIAKNFQSKNVATVLFALEIFKTESFTKKNY
jgi:hypothetical protein